MNEINGWTNKSNQINYFLSCFHHNIISHIIVISLTLMIKCHDFHFILSFNNKGLTIIAAILRRLPFYFEHTVADDVRILMTVETGSNSNSQMVLTRSVLSQVSVNSFCFKAKRCQARIVWWMIQRYTATMA